MLIAPVYRPRPQVDSHNIGAFRTAVIDSAERYGKVVVDCSSVVKMGVSAMRVLEVVSRDAQVTLINPNPAIRLMATTFDLDVEVQRPGRDYGERGSADVAQGLGRVTTRGSVPSTASCPGSLIIHRDGTVWGCTEDHEPRGCVSRDERHEGPPITCFLWSLAGCGYCGARA